MTHDIVTAATTIVAAQDHIADLDRQIMTLTQRRETSRRDTEDAKKKLMATVGPNIPRRVWRVTDTLVVIAQHGVGVHVVEIEPIGI